MDNFNRQPKNIPPLESNIVYQDRQNNAPTVPSRVKSKCSVSRVICIQLLALLFLAVLAAIIIPIVVLVLDSRSSHPPCARTYSESFINNVMSTAQCESWRTFTTGLTCSSYSMVRIYGPTDPTGITVSNSAVATALAIGLRYNTTLAVTYNGVTWRTGICGLGPEISATGTMCTCTSAGYTVRACHNGINWGGISGTTCSAASQTMSVYFE